MEADEGLDNMLKGMVGDEAIEHLPSQCYGLRGILLLLNCLVIRPGKLCCIMLES